MSSDPIREVVPFRQEDLFDKYLCPTKVRAAQEGKPHFIYIEATNRCPGSCKFCLATSSRSGTHDLPREKLQELIDELVQLGFRHIYWGGGEPLVHPALFDLVRYAASRGIPSGIFSGGIPLTRQVAREVCRLYQEGLINVFGIHIDTLDRQVFDRLHARPGELQARLEGYRNLLEAGFPPERILPCMTLTGPSAETFEETFDWFVEEMGARFLEVSVFKPQQVGGEHPELEPSLSDVRRVFEYRSRRFGSQNWARIGSTECSKIHCQTHFFLACNGDVMPCASFPREWAVGNIFQERLVNLFRDHGETIALRDIPIRGKCADCENNDICWGCRAAAYHYLGDVTASDPKCWLNPEARETYFR